MRRIVAVPLLEQTKPSAASQKKILQACRQHDAKAAEKAWLRWRSLQSVDFAGPVQSAAAVLDLQRYRYGIPDTSTWRGDELVEAFSECLENINSQPAYRSTLVLPKLNP